MRGSIILKIRAKAIIERNIRIKGQSNRTEKARFKWG